MSLITGVVFLSIGESGEVDEFIKMHYPKIGKTKSVDDECVGSKHCNFDIRAVGFNYLDLDQFYRQFNDFPWRDRPTIVVREREDDMLNVRIGDEARESKEETS